MIMRKKFILGILPLFVASLLLFSNPIKASNSDTFCEYTSYCAGYADAKEEAKPMTMEEWTAVYEGCVERKCPGY